MARKKSYTDLEKENDRNKLIAHIMTIAMIEPAQAIHMARDGKDRYVWRAYRLDGPSGGYLVCVFHGHSNGKPSLFYCDVLDRAIAAVTTGYARLTDANGMVQAVMVAKNARYQLERGERPDDRAERLEMLQETIR